MPEGSPRGCMQALREDTRLFSPFCWRVRLALSHKRLPFTSKIYRYADKEQISPFKTWPVLEHDGKRMDESLEIITYLDKTFPDTPQLLSHDDAGVAFVQNWIDVTLQSTVFQLCVADVWNHLHPRDQGYWRSSREERFGKTLEEVAGDQSEKLAQLREELQPVRKTVDPQSPQSHQFLGGSSPCIADLLLFSLFLWMQAVVKRPLLEKDDPILAWHSRMSKHYASALQGPEGKGLLLYSVSA